MRWSAVVKNDSLGCPVHELVGLFDKQKWFGCMCTLVDRRHEYRRVNTGWSTSCSEISTLLYGLLLDDCLGTEGKRFICGIEQKLRKGKKQSCFEVCCFSSASCNSKGSLSPLLIKFIWKCTLCSAVRNCLKILVCLCFKFCIFGSHNIAIELLLLQKKGVE